MTNNIEKLYEIAGVEKTKSHASCFNCPKKTIKKLDEWEQEYITCEHDGIFVFCQYAKELYPPFTVEKQLELIKWVQLLDNIDNLQMFHHELNNRWCFIVEMLPEFSSIPTERLHCSHEQFEQALSGLVIELWNDLTDEQKEEIKEILK